MQDSSLYKSERRASVQKASKQDPDERTLVRRAARHDTEAFARLYDLYVDKIFKYIYYKLGSKSEAEDLSGQVFLKAWEAIGSYRLTERPFSAWLYRIAHNLVVDHFRVRRPTMPLNEITSLEEKDADPDDLTLRHLTTEVLQRAMSRLTQEQRQVIILRFLEGYSTAEVSLIMGKKQGAVRTLQHRALASLERIFQRGSEYL
jgi:RNA polymerase sigma-70 factor (ECF subfamily)